MYAVVFNSSAYYQAQFNATLHFQNDVRYDRHYYVPSRSNRYGTPIFKEMILIHTYYYPESSDVVYVINYPPVFNYFWNGQNRPEF